MQNPSYSECFCRQTSVKSTCCQLKFKVFTFKNFQVFLQGPSVLVLQFIFFCNNMLPVISCVMFSQCVLLIVQIDTETAGTLASQQSTIVDYVRQHCLHRHRLCVFINFGPSSALYHILNAKSICAIGQHIWNKELVVCYSYRCVTVC